MTRLPALLAPAALLAVAACAGGSLAPDYEQPSTWAVRETRSAKAADVFYIHPTTFRSQDWNQALGDADTKTQTDLVARDNQLTAFGDCCARFMPYYRQASSRAFSERDAGGTEAYDFAYGDVRRAFLAYLAEDNGGRPFIVAGHSQGALHGLRLLTEEIAGTPAADRLVAAYLPGLGIPEASLPPGLPACERPDSTGCVVSWNSFRDGSDTSAYVARSKREYGDPERDSDLHCVNPLTFDRAKPLADASASLGAMPSPARPGPSPSPVLNKVSARCDHGVLMVTAGDGLPVEALPGGSLHMADIALFWGDISNNAVRRVAAWKDKR